MNKNNGRLVFLQSGADSRSTLGADSQGFPRLVLTTRKAQALTPRPYLLFFRYFNFVQVVLRQFWHQSKYRSVATSHSKSRTRKNHHQKKKKTLSVMFSPPESCLCHFSTWSKKVVIQLCFPLPKDKETHARPITHQPPKPIKSTPTAAEPNNHQPPQSPTPHLTHQPPKPNTLPSTTAAEDVDHRRCQSLR